MDEYFATIDEILYLFFISHMEQLTNHISAQTTSNTQFNKKEVLMSISAERLKNC